MLSRSVANTFLRSGLSRRGAPGLMRQSAAQQTVVQRRAMGGGGAFMETNSFGARVGEVFGTIAWLWVFHRFSQDGKVLLGMEHPWDHGHSHGHDDHGHGHSHGGKKLSSEDRATSWEAFADKAINPGEDDDDDDDDDDEDDDDDDDE